MLTAIQKEIVEQPGNLVLKASAGTGKTHTMVKKIEYEIKNHRSHKVIAAITFTVKAANEIKERLSINTRDHFIGTNNSFVIEEIIKPFMKDVYGGEFKLGMSTDYSVHIMTFEEGIAMVKNKNLLCSYHNNRCNFIFELALDIAKKSSACQLYLKSKYFKIYIDEYQDCDGDMHEFFMYLCDNLNIDTFVVGDEKQSIYTWRGADPKFFLSIWKKKNFSKKLLLDNFRSCQQIQNYSNLLYEETKPLYSEDNDLSSIIVVCTKSENWISDVQPYIDPSQKSALLRYSNADAELCAKGLTKCGLDFLYIPKTPISKITTDTAWFYTAIAKALIVKTYSAYDFRNEIPSGLNENKEAIQKIKYFLKQIKKQIANNDKYQFQKQVANMAEHFGFTTKPEHCQKLYETIINKKFHLAFHVDDWQRVSLTLHSSKGLEFDQVIVFLSDYPLSEPESLYNHYVAITRAKKRLIMVFLFDNESCSLFSKNIGEILKESKLTMYDVSTVLIYDQKSKQFVRCTKESILSQHSK